MRVSKCIAQGFAPDAITRFRDGRRKEARGSFNDDPELIVAPFGTDAREQLRQIAIRFRV